MSGRTGQHDRGLHLRQRNAFPPIKGLAVRSLKIDTHYWQLNFGKNSSEQLYHIAVDPDCLINLADTPEFKETQEKEPLDMSKHSNTAARP